MKGDEIIAYALTAFEGLTMLYHLGEKGIFYNPGKKLATGTYFLTVKEETGSKTKQERTRFSLCIRRGTFQGVFGYPPEQFSSAKATPGYFEQEDMILPHPEHAHMGWIMVLNPTEKSFRRLKPLMKDAYELAKERFGEKWKKKTTSIMRRPG